MVESGICRGTYLREPLYLMTIPTAGSSRGERGLAESGQAWTVQKREYL